MEVMSCISREVRRWARRNLEHLKAGSRKAKTSKTITGKSKTQAGTTGGFYRNDRKWLNQREALALTSVSERQEEKKTNKRLCLHANGVSDPRDQGPAHLCSSVVEKPLYGLDEGFNWVL